jgi:hypothetical protein
MGSRRGPPADLNRRFGVARRLPKGSRVIYLKQKHSTHPSRKARDVHAAPKGELYDYVIEKCRIVELVRDDGQLVLRTPKGNLQVVSPDDPGLRPATLWERIRYRDRFAKAAAQAGKADASAS